MPELDSRLSGSANSVVDMQQFSNPESSCPDLIRASMPFLPASEGVDGRIKSGSRGNEVPAAASGFVETAIGHDDVKVVLGPTTTRPQCTKI